MLPASKDCTEGSLQTQEANTLSKQQMNKAALFINMKPLALQTMNGEKKTKAVKSLPAIKVTTGM